MPDATPDAGTDPRRVLAGYAAIPALVRGLAAGRTDAELDRRTDVRSMTARETVHHLAEANVVAASIAIAALGSPGAVYDWSWMWPGGPWIARLGYGAKPVLPSLALLDALCAYVVAQVEPLADGLAREARLRDEAGGPLRTVTVAGVLAHEVAHAREHVEAARRGLGA